MPTIAAGDVSEEAKDILDSAGLREFATALRLGVSFPGVPSFATGGFHTGGPAIVGERGPEYYTNLPRGKVTAQSPAASGTSGGIGNFSLEVYISGTARDEVEAVLTDKASGTQRRYRQKARRR
jgi:hypothetical protein